MSENSVNSGGIGFLGLLTIVFVIAKLTGYITWSWFWVFSPILIGTVVGIILIIVILIIAALAK